MAIPPAAVNAAALAAVRKPPARAALSPDELRQAAQTRKAAVAGDAAKARSSPLFQAGDSRKSQARAKLQQLREWLKIVKKLYAQNPKGMAKALTEAFKEMKAAVQAYKDAGGEEMGAAGGAVDAAIAPQPAQADAPDEAEPAADGADDENAEAAAPELASTSAAEAGLDPLNAFDGRGRYDAVVGEVRKMIGEDGLEFLKEVRGMVDELRKLLDTARGQAAIRKRDKDTDQAFDDADEALKQLNQSMSRMDSQIHLDAPMAGMTLSVAA